MRLEYWLPRLYLLLLLALLATAGWQWRGAAPVSADLMALVPGHASDHLVQQAQQRLQAPLNRELLALVGDADQGRAIARAKALAGQWQASGVFEQVQWSLQADIPAVREQLLRGRLAMLAPADREQLQHAPEAFVQQRLQSLFDPFTGFSLVSNENDWLGLAQRIQNSQPQHGSVQLDTASGALVAHGDGLAWVLLRARTAADAFDLSLPERVATLVAAAQRQSQAEGGRLLVASGLLYAANGQQQARHEMTWVGGGATLGIILLLLLVFRRARVLVALLPVAVGMLAGTTLCIAVFGSVHVITLVLGASLIGVAVDYPLHYLSKCWSLQPWQPWRALRITLPGLALSLATTCIGYLALAFTPFPALTQIALFSAGGLAGAWLTATWLLPALFKGATPRPAAWPLQLAEALMRLRQRLLARVGSYWLLAGLLLLCAGGVYKLQVRNDLRQWIDSSPSLLEQAKAVARITGYQPTSQFFLVQGQDENQLLERQQALAERLAPLVADRSVQGFLALSQLVAPASEQATARAALAQLPAHWQPLVAAGIPENALHAEVEALQKLPTLSIDQALAGPLGEPWRLLWLGPTHNGVAAAVSLQGLAKPEQLAALAESVPGVQWVDRLGELNRTFADTQVSAAELKLLSCGLILLLLVAPFGLGGAAKLVALPLLAALCSLAGLGWLGQPLTLFSVFGLLLATAISVDYAILMREQVGGAATSLLGTLLAAITTWLSFGLLMVSSTPAVSNFGLAVSLGLVFSFLLAPWAGDTTRPEVSA